MKKILIIAGSYIIILGVIALALNYTLGLNITYITKMDNYGIGMYYYDFSAYLNGLKTTLNQIAQIQLLETPENAVYNWSDIINSLKSVLNGVINGINYIIFVNNAIFVSFKIAMYIFIIAMAFFGLNIEGFDMYTFAITIYNASIPYIPYI